MSAKYKFILCLYSGFWIAAIPLYSQTRFEIGLGLGFPEMVNISAMYGKNVQVGLSQSVWPRYKTGEIVPMGPTSLKICYHFGGEPKYSEQKVWYLLGGLGCFWNSPGGFSGEEGIHYCFYPRVGRTFNLSDKLGFCIDVGTYFPLNFPSGESDIWPSINANLFIRL